MRQRFAINFVKFARNCCLNEIITKESTSPGFIVPSSVFTSDRLTRGSKEFVPGKQGLPLRDIATLSSLYRVSIRAGIFPPTRSPRPSRDTTPARSTSVWSPRPNEIFHFSSGSLRQTPEKSRSPSPRNVLSKMTLKTARYSINFYGLSLRSRRHIRK